MSKTRKPNKRDPVAYDLNTNGLYRPKVQKDKKKEQKKNPPPQEY